MLRRSDPHSEVKARRDFVPLKALLSKNLDDRIQDYLTRMDGMTVDEIVSGGPVLNSPRKRNQDEEDQSSSGATVKQQKIIENTRQQAKTLAKQKSKFQSLNYLFCR